MEWIFLFRHNQEENLPGVRAGNSDRNTDGRNCLFLFPCVFVNICLWCVFCVLSVLRINDLHVCFVVLCKWPFKSFRFLISPSLLRPLRTPNSTHTHAHTHLQLSAPLCPPPPTPHTHNLQLSAPLCPPSPLHTHPPSVICPLSAPPPPLHTHTPSVICCYAIDVSLFCSDNLVLVLFLLRGVFLHSIICTVLFVLCQYLKPVLPVNIQS